MPVESAKAGLLLFDKLFPIDNGWFYEYQGTKVLKLFPCTFRGIGAYLRLRRINAKEYKVFESPEFHYLAPNMLKWHNAAAELLNTYGKTA